MEIIQGFTPIVEFIKPNRITFKGCGYLPDDADEGDVYMLGEDLYIYIDGKFELAASPSDVVSSDNTHREPIKIKCTSCSSTHIEEYRGHLRCSYCGTQYR